MNVFPLEVSNLFRHSLRNLDTCQKDGNSNIALASLDWVYSDIAESSSQITFNITAGSSAQFSGLQFVNHLNKSGIQILRCHLISRKRY